MNTTFMIIAITVFVLIANLLKIYFKESNSQTKQVANKQQEAAVKEIIETMTNDASVSAVTKIEPSLDGKFIVTFLDIDNKRQTAVYHP